MATNAKHVKPDVVLYSALVNAYARRGLVAPAERVVAGMQRAGLRPNTVTYNSLLNGCASTVPPATKDAERIFREMAHASVKPNRTTVSTLGRALGKAEAGRLCADLGVEINSSVSDASHVRRRTMTLLETPQGRGEKRTSREVM